MKTIMAALTCAMLASSAAAADRSGRLGAGVELGEQNGVTAKYWTTESQALSAGLGASGGTLSVHAEYLWHAFDLFPKPPQGIFEGHLGLGGRLRWDEIGIRPLAGVGYWIENHPIELFLEGGPVFRLHPETTTDLSLVVGLRAYFGK